MALINNRPIEVFLQSMRYAYMYQASTEKTRIVCGVHALLLSNEHLKEDPTRRCPANSVSSLPLFPAIKIIYRLLQNRGILYPQMCTPVFDWLHRFLSRWNDLFL